LKDTVELARTDDTSPRPATTPSKYGTAGRGTKSQAFQPFMGRPILKRATTALRAFGKKGTGPFRTRDFPRCAAGLRGPATFFSERSKLKTPKIFLPVAPSSAAGDNSGHEHNRKG